MIHRNMLTKAFKTCCALLVGLLIQTNCYGQASELSVHDTRTVNDLPSAFQYKVRFDFKDRVVIGVPGTGAYSGMMTIAPWGDASGGKNHQLNFNDGGIFYRTGAHNVSSWEAWRKLLVEDVNGNVGIGTLSPQNRLQIVGGHSNTNMNFHYENPMPERNADLTLWASEPGLTYTGVGIGNNVYNSVEPVAGIQRISTVKGGSYMRLLEQEIRFNVVKLDGTDITSMAVDASGNVGVGTADTKGYKLAVAGNMVAESVKVKLQGAWPDYVFTSAYKVPTLQDTEKHIKEKGHLPGIPSASEVKANGVDLGDMNAKLLQKIEELTLHLIRQEKEIGALKELVKGEKISKSKENIIK
ncbi:hypothetical protein [Pedobacter frigoris]|uniref:Uncharacterized protein n=1 Tax=Pedobacter frigoris TaxID=2571272 RepID=A0A4U1CFW8_9SPHI|nr:hypothetical protein [Pedobacter frigoris]TKC05247.1 hypothetical protein FA047_15945 [Pedobacter frigoris]